MKKLQLVLKGYWYHQIDSGEKKIEYRDNTPLWRTRILNERGNEEYDKRYADSEKHGLLLSVPFGWLKHSLVVFHFGYKREPTMTFQISEVIMNGRQIEIYLGERLSEKDVEMLEKLVENRPALAPPKPRRNIPPKNPQWR